MMIFKYAMHTQQSPADAGPGVMLASVPLPKGSKVLTAQWKDDGIYLWAMATEDTAKIELRRFEIWMTGEHVAAPEELVYLTTLQHQGIVLHVFERVT